MKLSFLVTYYNQQDYVSTSLDSILNQKIPCEFEILVGDDGSDDNTLEIVKSYQKQYPDKIRIYQMPRESGVQYNAIRRASANRLNLLKYVTGDYLMFLDGDDFYCDNSFLPIALEKLTDNPDLVAYGFRFRRLSSDGSVKLIKPLVSKCKVCFAKDAVKKYSHVGAFVFRNIFDDENLEMFEKLGYFDDEIIVFWFLNFGKFYYNAERIIYNYRLHEEGIFTGKSTLEKQIWLIVSQKILLRLCEKHIGSFWERHINELAIFYGKIKKLEKVAFEMIEKEYKKYDVSAIEQIGTESNYERFLDKLLIYGRLSLADKLWINFFYYFRIGGAFCVSKAVERRIRRFLRRKTVNAQQGG